MKATLPAHPGEPIGQTRGGRLVSGTVKHDSAVRREIGDEVEIAVSEKPTDWTSTLIDDHVAGNLELLHYFPLRTPEEC